MELLLYRLNEWGCDWQVLEDIGWLIESVL